MKGEFVRCKVFMQAEAAFSLMELSSPVIEFSKEVIASHPGAKSSKPFW